MKENTDTNSLHDTDKQDVKKSDDEATHTGNEVDEVISRIKKMPQHQQQKTIAKLEMYSGPIPHPDILREYNEMDPGAAKQIIDNGVAESRHRRELENKSMEYTRRDRKRRDWMGFCIAIVIILVGALLIYFKHVLTGTILSGVSAIGIVSLFLSDDSQTSSTAKSDSQKAENKNQA